MKTKLAATGGAPAQTFVDDVFSTYLYTGNNSTQNINNGIDLAGKGGMVWSKSRSAVGDNHIYDTARGIPKVLFTNGTNPSTTYTSGSDLTSFNTTGFSLGPDDYGTNTNAVTYASWTFRKAAKFFDVVTYTGTGSARTIAHSLGVAPGMVIVKRTNTAEDWYVQHRGLTSYDNALRLNTTVAQLTSTTFWNSTAPTATDFTLGNNGSVNGTGNTYVAYLFAHDTSSTGIIQCGSFTTDGSGDATVNLGWEPQYLMVKASSSVDNWYIVDSMRGFVAGGASGSDDARLYANTSGAENATAQVGQPTATGFLFNIGTASTTFIYMAIRRPNKPPTSGTQVYQGTTYSGNTTTITGTQLITTNLPVDLSIIQDRSNGNGTAFVDRLRGSMVRLQSAVTNADVANSGAYKMDYQNNFLLGDYNWNYTGRNYVNHAFKRALGFFDEVCYTGDGVASRAVPHNLTVAPELMILKTRNWAQPWIVYASPVGATKYLVLNQNFTPITGAAFVDTTPTSSVFYVNGTFSINSSAVTVVAYLFATLAGISKVGSYTGNGSTGQAIACGFSAGARFVLIKRTDAAGDWYTFDSARGLTSGSSPYLLLNSTAAEVTGNNGVYASTGGFTLGSTASTTTNINGASYIFLAVS